MLAADYYDERYKKNVLQSTYLLFVLDRRQFSYVDLNIGNAFISIISNLFLLCGRIFTILNLLPLRRRKMYFHEPSESAEFTKKMLEDEEDVDCLFAVTMRRCWL